MRSGIVKLLKIFLLAISGFVLTGIVVGMFYGEEIKQLIIREINKNIASEITVGKIDFSLLRHFPNATVEIADVVAKDAMTGENKAGNREKENISALSNPLSDTLLTARHLSLLFNIGDLFSKNISIKKIILQDADVHIRIDEKGRNNYHFWKSSNGDDSTSSASVINLEQIILKNTAVNYSNIHDHQQYQFTTKDGTVKGKFTDEEFELNTVADLFVTSLYASGSEYVQNKNVQLKSKLTVNNKSNQYKFEKTEIGMEGLLFEMAGDVTSTTRATAMNLLIHSRKASLKDLMKVLPAQYQASVSQHLERTKGKVAFEMAISGEAGHGYTPDVKVSFSISEGQYSPENTSATIKGVNLKGTFLSSSSRLQELTVESFKGKLDGKELTGNFKITDFKNPYLTLQAKAEVDLNSVRPFISHDTLESLSGNMKMDISFAGKIKDLKQYASRVDYHSKSSGAIALKNVSFKLKRNPLEFKGISGQLTLNDNDVEVQSLEGAISSTDFHLHGTFKNFITFLLIPNQDAMIDISFSSSLIELNELLANKAAGAASDTSYKIKINPRLVCNLNVSAKKLVFRKFEATNITGIVHIANQNISSQNLVFNAMNGNVMMSANIATARRDSVLMACKAKIDRINITQLFSEMENFGQTTMTDKNVKGALTADVAFNSSWTKDLVINPAKVISQAEIEITNGELNDFRPILPLSKYLKLADLKHIKFSTLKNNITIRDRKIYFPSMEINSSALSLTANGVHDFDNNVDYKLRMLLSDVLGKKVKAEENTEFGIIEDDGLGHSKLFLAMKGPIDNPKFSIDKKAVGKKIKSDLIADQHNIKQMLKQEFGMYKKDTALQVQKKKKQELQVDWGN